MSSPLAKLVATLEMRAIERTDSEEQKLKKNLLIFACGMMSFGVVLWLAIYWAMGLQFSTTIPLVYQLISVTSLAYYLVKRNFESFRNIQLSLFLFVPFVMQWSIGNAITASGVMLWALLAPLGAVFFHGWRESIPWFIAYLVLTAASGFIDFYLATGRESGIPLTTIAIFFGLNFAAISTIVYLFVRYFVAENEKIKQRLDREHAMLQQEQAKSERLLLNVLPEHIAVRLKQNETTIADGLADVTVMFADIVNFTKLTEEMAPEEMVALLNKVFSNFDFLLEKYGLEKIKTIGDAYMAAGGLVRGRTDYVHGMAEMALEMRTLVAEHPALRRHNLSIHMGVATGPVVAGVIGTKRFIYDLWGDTVNIASRLTAEGVPGRIQVDRITHARLRNRFQFEGPFTVTVKGKGEMTVYRLIGRLPQEQGLAAGA